MREDLQKKYDAFWENKAIDGPMLYLQVDNSPPVGDITPEQKWTDIDYRMKRFEQSDIAYYGDAYPYVFADFGPGSLAPCIGGNFIPAEYTIWFDQNPIIKDWDDINKLRFDKNSEMWNLMTEYCRRLCEKGSHKISIPDLGGTMDIIASLRGTDALLYDLYDNREEVLRCIEIVSDLWEHSYNLIADLLAKYQEGSATWWPIWSRGRSFTLQCDFCAMISPDMYNDFIHPHIKRQTEFLDNSIFHLDGPGQISHLDMMLTLPKLDAIQWVPGDGSPSVFDPCWDDLYEKIQRADKGITFWCSSTELDEYEKWLRRFDTSKGIFIYCVCKEEKEAKEMIKIAKLS